MTKRIAVLVEGQTEETFVNEILSPHLNKYGIFPYATMVCTRRIRSRRANRGGISNYQQVKNDLLLLAKDTDVKAITTMFDFYAFPSDAPGFDTLSKGDCYSEIMHLEKSFKEDITDTRFIPYIMLHEFEAFLFCDPSKMLYCFPDNSTEISEMNKIKEQFDSPEEINNSPETAPSKRILNLFNNYQKPLHGCTTLLEIGIENIREECKHFNEWLQKLESL